MAFALAFLIKMPAFPFHGWMPDAYRNMPLPALAVFSGVVSKVAAYGFLRIVLPLFPAAAEDFQLIVLILALCSILYGSIQAFTQTNLRLILGYSSVAQLGFITLGIFALDEAARGAQGALLQAVNHGLVVAPLFLIIVLLAARAGGSEDIRDMGGIAFRAPVLATLFMIVTLATLAMPGSANFVGEFLILLGVFQSKLAIALIASTGVVLASVYALRMYIRAMHNRAGPDGDVVRDVAARRRSCSCRSCWRSSRSRCTRSAALDAGEPAVQGGRPGAVTGAGAMTPEGARTSTGRRCRRWWRWPAAPASCCWSGLLRSRFVRRQRRAAAGAGDARRDGRPVRLAVGRRTPRSSSARWRSTT